MQSINVTVPSKVYHIAQIVTGFHLLKQQGWEVTIRDCSGDRENPFYGLPVAVADYRGKRIVYDLWDGYQDPEDMEKCLAACDVYFKRSFSAEKNARLFPAYAEKMYPLGFNYHVTYPGNPVNEPLVKSLLKPLLGKAPEPYFTPKVFEGQPVRKENGEVRILFQAQLWDVRDPSLSVEMAEECDFINRTRMEILRSLRGSYGPAFFGGLKDTRLARELAPELIVPETYTERRKYLKLVHGCDICIGTMGLHESIGWKTAEYVAAAKAIVNERFHYSVPGAFREGVHYLPFQSAAECLQAVRTLVDSPEARFAMQQANADYYQACLRPDVLVKNTLSMVEQLP